MLTCYICERESDDEYTIFEKDDGNYVCKGCIETKYELKELFKGLIIQQGKAAGLTKESTDRLIISYI